MSKPGSALVFILTVIIITLQGLIWHVWNAGALNQFANVHGSFGSQVPQALLFGVRSASLWWVAPLGNALLLSFVCFMNNRSRWLFLPFALSCCALFAMLYVMYSDPLIKMGEGVAMLT